jgi:hypothetical protein
LDMVAVVFESVRKQTDSLILAARHGSKKHRQPPDKVGSPPFYKRGATPVSGESVEICASFVEFMSLRTPPFAQGSCKEFVC